MRNLLVRLSVCLFVCFGGDWLNGDKKKVLYPFRSFGVFLRGVGMARGRTKRMRVSCA